ncbi:Alpha/Beta hydrolase protein [Syncephalis pseudoplumigaleata]|uniref:Alpha/Beta hydrolase protein n=1 Tax=Syncephalis pseudoplumigaleata TaxID=1712513 RepID=A0A4P9Z2R3_9FUNG|nr:Alpha/Beta hydrolase protein [Syncephalis pseudoplumigaleata]|eukprot:RKP26823.1 Alpha/Beta hydrolase protein [Syncephalis pseudoplumigaleata]
MTADIDGAAGTASTLLSYLTPRCPSLFGPKAHFRSTPWLANGHFQTAWAAYGSINDAYPIVYERELLDLPDGGQVALDWTPSRPTPDTAAMPIFIVVTGLTGGSQEDYVRSLLTRLTLAHVADDEHGTHAPVCRGVVMNFRGCANTRITTPRLYCGAWTDDLRYVVSYIREQCPDAELGAAGFSLGSNVLVKYLGEEGEACPFKFAMSISNPFDFLAGSLALERGLLGRTIYSPQLCKNLQQVYLTHYDQLKLDPRLDAEKIMKAKTIREFDRYATSVLFGYDTVDDYYRDASSSRWITRVRVPLLCLNACDDPVTSIEGAPYDEIRINPFVIIATTSCGGHIGWFENMLRPRRWSDKPLSEFARAMFAVSERRRRMHIATHGLTSR